MKFNAKHAKRNAGDNPKEEFSPDGKNMTGLVDLTAHQIQP
jgi:hypothetical protein